MGGCRSAESRAAERAQDACIGALEPIADNEAPTVGQVADAVADAEAAADVDPRRWDALRARLRAVRGAIRGTPGYASAIQALVKECEHVNEVVRSGGEEVDES